MVCTQRFLETNVMWQLQSSMATESLNHPIAGSGTSITSAYFCKSN